MKTTRTHSRILLVFAGWVLTFSFPLSAQAAQNPSLLEFPVARVSLFSSGVGYFEHSGRLAGDATVGLTLREEAVDDVLKSLIVFPGAGEETPTVSYPAKIDPERFLRSLPVDLSGSPSAMEILSRMRGAEAEVVVGGAQGRISGRILSAEYRPAGSEAQRPYLVLSTPEGIRSLALEGIDSVRFADPVQDADFRRALEFLGRARMVASPVLELRFPGRGERGASFGYVAEAPVWKATYRLDFSGSRPFFQGWAIVDNATERDWRGVILSVVSGRPVSFVQPLYEPTFVERPIIPLGIAGSARPREYAAGIAEDSTIEMESESPRGARLLAAPAQSVMKASPLSQASFSAASARAAGDQFSFTFPRRVDLPRGRSALLPLLSGEIAASKASLYTSGSGRAVLGARLENSTGMKLPAGPITVFDGGVYAGDALLDFFPEKGSRFIAFGDDVSLAVDESSSATIETVGVSLSKGVLAFSKRRSISKTYTFQNSGDQEKTVVVEHPETVGAALAAPGEYLEKADGLYRFSLAVPAGKKASLVVVERTPARETVSLESLGAEAFLRYASSAEIPLAVRDALSAAAVLRRKVDEALRQAQDAESRKVQLAGDQERIRKNLEALGRETPEGARYVQRLLAAEADIERVDAAINAARRRSAEARAEYEAFIAGLVL